MLHLTLRGSLRYKTLGAIGLVVFAAFACLPMLHAEGATSDTGLAATIPGAYAMTSNSSASNVYVTASDGKIRRVTTSGGVRILNTNTLPGATTGIALDETDHTLYFGVAGSPGSIWSLPQSGGTALKIYDLPGSKSPSGISFFTGLILIATGSAGKILVINPQGVQLASSPANFGPEASAVSIFQPGSSAVIVIVDRANSTLYVTDASGGWPILATKYVNAGVNSATSLQSALIIGTSSGLAFWIGGPLQKLPTQPDVTGVAINLSGSAPVLWELDGGQYVRMISEPGAVTNALATPENESALISWVAPVHTGGFAQLVYKVSVVGDSSKSCTTTGTSCVVHGLTNGTNYHFTIGYDQNLFGGNEVTTNAATPSDAPTTTSAPVTTSTTVTTSATTAHEGLAVTGADTNRLVSLGVGSMFAGGLVLLRRRLSRV